MQNITKGLSESTKKTILASLPLVISILLFILVGNFGLSKIRDIRSQIALAKNDESILKEKLNVLQALSPTATVGVSVTAAALPENNPSLVVISQLKRLAATNGLVISGVKSSSGSQSSSGLNEVTTSFLVDGQRSVVFKFMKAISTIAPITTIDQVKITQNGGIVRADLGVKSYSAPYPKTIPSVTQKISDLTGPEKELLKKISALTQPVFIEAAPLQGGINPNPFGQ